MTEFTQQLARMVAQARIPVVPPQGGPTFIGTYTKIKPGYGNLGASLGAALGSYIGSRLRYNRPEEVRKRALETYNLLSDPEKFTDEQRKRILNNSTVQEQLRQYQAVAPEYFLVGEDGMVDIIPQREPAQRRLVEAQTEEVRAREGRIKKLLPVVEAALKQDVHLTEARANLLDLEQRLRSKEAPLKRKELETTIREIRERIKSSQQVRQQREESFPLEQERRRAETVKTQQEALTEVQRGELLEVQKLLYQKQAQDYDQEILRELTKAETEEQLKHHQELFNVRLMQDKELRDKYDYDVRFNPMPYTLEDIGYTQAMVDALGSINQQVGTDASGRGLYLEIPTVLASPTAQFWVNKSINEAFNTFLYLLPSKSTDLLWSVLNNAMV